MGFWSPSGFRKFLINLFYNLKSYSVLKSPHKSSSLRRESISMLPGGTALYVGL